MVDTAGLMRLASWLWLAVAHGRFWDIRPLLHPAPPLPDSAKDLHVVAIVPARNEAKTIEQRVGSLAFVFFFFLLYPPLRICDARSRVAGGCILLRPETLNRNSAVGVEVSRWSRRRVERPLPDRTGGSHGS
ncbi:MAG TPA: hypothetical protein VES20_17675 [Bryobacteraceae bacterium]|nr:hypothetical protein [Bryobacteraceae bacterium]